MITTAAILTASDRAVSGERTDESGPLLRDYLQKERYEIREEVLVPDERALIAQALIRLADVLHCQLIVTTGGTGVHPRDVTPEATKLVIEKEIPGIGEAMRAASVKVTPFGMVSRGVSGIRGSTLIINFPGSPKAIRETFPIVRPILGHAMKLLRGGRQNCATTA